MTEQTTVERLIAEINQELETLQKDYSGLSLRERVLRLTEVLKKDRSLNVKIACESGCNASDARRRLLLYLQSNVGIPVHATELEVVASISEYARRVRELRTEEGYAIATRYTGRPDLPGNWYVLESVERVAEPHDRRIQPEVQKLVYERDANTCRLCGGTIEHWVKPGSSMLELHHIQNHAARGSNLASNLIVLCNVCHDEVHAGRLALPDGLLDPLR